jgi:lipopolysaccharide/colanic/teichoic acid biosynthesis glycosyltransferase
VTRPSSERAKRLLDLALLLPTLPAFGAVTALLALAVLVVDGRPVFFVQERLGRRGRPFRVYKLRTMTTEVDVDTRRPTALGRVLRRHGVDELPQLFCVLMGHMSLVGPRPLTPSDHERLVARHPPFARRLEVKPGITGLAQVHPSVGVEATTAWDTEYVHKRSMRLDLAILLRTLYINVVGKERGSSGAGSGSATRETSCVKLRVASSR